MIWNTTLREASIGSLCIMSATTDKQNGKLGDLVKFYAAIKLACEQR